MEMELQEARSWQGWRGERRQRGQRGQEGTEEGAWGDPAPGAGSCQPDLIPVPHLSPGVLANPAGFFFQDTPPKGSCSVWFCSRTCPVAGNRLFQSPFSVTPYGARANLTYSKRFNIPGSQGLASSPTPLQAQASPAKKAYFAPIYSPDPNFTF